MENTKQQSILQTLNVNLWITANAGSGKTTQLVNRFLFLLQNGIKPEEIVCITYTEAGAKEMKDRIISIAKQHNLNIKEHQLKQKEKYSFIHPFNQTKSLKEHLALYKEHIAQYMERHQKEKQN